MLLIDRRHSDGAVVSKICIAVYAIMRTVHSMTGKHNHDIDVRKLLWLHAKEGTKHSQTVCVELISSIWQM